jgi:putative phosphoesterase
MRMAIVSDVHGNLTALEAVIADLRVVAPDVILHGGDLADAGASPVGVLDTIQHEGWQGVSGNTDEALFRPESLVEFAARTPAFAGLLASIEEQAQWTRTQLGEERLQWLRKLPRSMVLEGVALVHATASDLWRSPNGNASDDELEAAYNQFRSPVVVFGHIHQPFVRVVGTQTIVNSGSVGMPLDGDPRASYAVVDGDRAEIRRVAYDVRAEVRRLESSSIPYAARLARTLLSARPQME